MFSVSSFKSFTLCAVMFEESKVTVDSSGGWPVEISSCFTNLIKQSEIRNKLKKKKKIKNKIQQFILINNNHFCFNHRQYALIQI